MNEYEHLKAQVDAIEAREAATKKARLDAIVACRVALDNAAGADTLEEARKICESALIESARALKLFD